MSKKFCFYPLAALAQIKNYYKYTKFVYSVYEFKKKTFQKHKKHNLEIENFCMRKSIMYLIINLINLCISMFTHTSNTCALFSGIDFKIRYM